MTFNFGKFSLTLSAGQITALLGVVSAVYTAARAFGVVDVASVPVV